MLVRVPVVLALVAAAGASAAGRASEGSWERYLQRDQESYAEDNGGTVCAIGGPDWCVLASDTRLRRAYGIVTRGASRIFRAEEGSTFGVASAGCWADTLALRSQLDRDLEAYQWEGRWAADRGDLPHTAAVVQRLAGILYRRRGTPFYVQNVVGGLDASGRGVAYGFDPLGSFEGVPVACAGSARGLVQPVLDAMVEQRDDGLVLRALSADEAVRQVVAAFRAAAERDITVGDECEIRVWRRGRPVESLREALRHD